MDPIANKNSTVTIDDKGIFTVRWAESITLEKEDFEMVVIQYDELTQGAMWKVLHVFPSSTRVSSKGRNYAEKREKPAAAEAFVIGSRTQRNLFRFYRKFRSIEYPMREFSNVEDAHKWLDGIKSK